MAGDPIGELDAYVAGHEATIVFRVARGRTMHVVDLHFRGYPKPHATRTCACCTRSVNGGTARR